MKAIEEIRALRPDQRSLAEIEFMASYAKIEKDLEATLSGQMIGQPFDPANLIGMNMPGPCDSLGTVTAAEMDGEMINMTISYPVECFNISMTICGCDQFMPCSDCIVRGREFWATSDSSDSVIDEPDPED